MAADEKDRFIQYLVGKVNMFELDKRATELAVEEFHSTYDSVSASLESIKKEMEDIKAELRKEHSKRKKAEAKAKARKLDQQLKYAKKIISATSARMPARTRKRMLPQTYHSVISTVMLHVISYWDFLVKSFKKIYLMEVESSLA